MKNNFKFLAVALIAFTIGITVNNFAMSDVPSDFKVAVVNVPKIIESSAQVKALKEQNNKNIQELAKFGETAQKAINNEKNEKKQKALKDKYQKEFQAKRADMSKTYEKRLIEIDKNISDVIDAQAKAKGYNLVLAKASVLSGGVDITNDILKQIK